MGCNCGKNKLNAINEKYGDGSINETKSNPFIKMLEIIAQLGFGILCGAIIIVMIVPILIYVILCIMFGKQATFKLKKINKFLNKN